MKAIRYDPITHKEKDYELPKGAVSYIDDLSTVISCACCGYKITAENTYTSRQIMTKELGFGYLVCPNCYKKEFEEEQKGKK